MIRETKRALAYEDGIRKDSYFTRYVEFGSGVNQIAWASLKRIENLQELKAKIENHQHTIPAGLISMWSGQDLPDGWALCDGRNNTPDLRNKFIMGASDKSQIGRTGGEKEVKIATNQMPRHSHGVSIEKGGRHSHKMSRTKNHTHAFNNYYFIESDSTDDGRSGNAYGYESIATGIGSHSHDKDNKRVFYKVSTTEGAGSHDHFLSDSAEHLHNVTVHEAGENRAHENRPPFYALAFIIKL